MKNTQSVGFHLFQNLLVIVSKNYRIDNHHTFNLFQEGVKEFKDFIFLQDTLIDQEIDWLSQTENTSNTLTKINNHYKKAIISLLKVFPENHLFWDYLQEEEKLYYHFITKEKYNNAKKPFLNLQDFEEMAYAKHSLALVAVKGMSYLFEENISHDDIKKIFGPIFLGMQMMDDIDDFGKDFKSGQWNLIQSEVQYVIYEESLVNENTLDRFEERVLYASGLCEKYSIYALEKYTNALSLAEKFGFTDLNQWLTKIIEEMNESLDLVRKLSS